MVEYINDLKISLLWLVGKRKIIANQEHQVSVRQRLQIGPNYKVSKFVQQLLDLWVWLLLQTIQARLIMLKSLNKVAEELSLFQTVVNVGHM